MYLHMYILLFVISDDKVSCSLNSICPSSADFFFSKLKFFQEHYQSVNWFARLSAETKVVASKERLKCIEFIRIAIFAL